MNLAEVARQMGVCAQLVSATVNGEKHSPLVLGKLRELGVPEKYLFAPNRPEPAGSEQKVA
jgi:transcriptional regulator with XRE-family HTH domain